MKKHYPLLSILILAVVALFILGPRAYAEDVRFDQLIQDTHAQRAQMEAQLGLNPQAGTFPYATSYYDDLVDHYEQDQLMRDVIAQGI